MIIYIKLLKNTICDIDGFGKYAVKYFTTIQELANIIGKTIFKIVHSSIKPETTIKSGILFYNHKMHLYLTVRDALF